MRVQFVKSVNEIHIGFKYVASGNDVPDRNGEPWKMKWTCSCRLNLKLLRTEAKRKLMHIGLLKPIDDLKIWNMKGKPLELSHLVWDTRWTIPVKHRGPISGKVLSNRLKTKTPKNQVLLSHYFNKEHD